jgi:hypothetical protein
MARRRLVSSYACDELKEVCQGRDIVSARKEIKIVDQGKRLKETSLC